MVASRDSIDQIAELMEDMVNFGTAKNQDVWPARLREITGNTSLTETCELLAQELEKRWGLKRAA